MKNHSQPLPLYLKILLFSAAIFVIAFIALSLIIPFQEPFSEQTLAENRKAFQQTLIDSMILAPLQKPLEKSNEDEWAKALWAMELAQYRSDTVENALKEAFNQYQQINDDLKRALLEAVYGLYPEEFVSEIRSVLQHERDPQRFAMAALYLHRASFTIETGMEIRNLLLKKFKHLPNDPTLGMFRAELYFRPEIPPIDLLLSPDFLEGYPIFYTFFRQNRDYPGITILRRVDGSLKLEKDQSLWYIEHLGRSYSGLPDYLFHGNTPEGLYSIQGIQRSENEWVGPTPIVVLKMPHEIPPSVFFHGSPADSVWDQSDYRDVLPLPWRDYLPVYTSYYAGKAGRKDIAAHGTTIDPEFYKGKPWYPLTPSLGCLTALELWDEKTGKRTLSHQQKLIDCFHEEKINKGFWIVIDVNNREKPVTVEELALFSHLLSKDNQP